MRSRIGILHATVDANGLVEDESRADRPRASFETIRSAKSEYEDRPGGPNLAFRQNLENTLAGRSAEAQAITGKPDDIPYRGVALIQTATAGPAQMTTRADSPAPDVFVNLAAKMADEPGWNFNNVPKDGSAGSHGGRKWC